MLLPILAATYAFTFKRKKGEGKEGGDRKGKRREGKETGVKGKKVGREEWMDREKGTERRGDPILLGLCVASIAHHFMAAP